MKKKTYSFNRNSSIPGIPGEFHGGLDVDIDEDEMKVLDVRLRDAPPENISLEKPEKNIPKGKKATGPLENIS